MQWRFVAKSVIDKLHGQDLHHAGNTVKLLINLLLESQALMSQWPDYLWYTSILSTRVGKGITRKMWCGDIPHATASVGRDTWIRDEGRVLLVGHEGNALPCLLPKAIAHTGGSWLHASSDKWSRGQWRNVQREGQSSSSYRRMPMKYEGARDNQNRSVGRPKRSWVVWSGTYLGTA